MMRFKINLLLLLAVTVIIQADDYVTKDNEENSSSATEKQESSSEFGEEGEVDNDDDVEGRKLKEIQVYTSDERCNDVGVCSGFDYGNKQEIVSFVRKPEIRFTSDTTYNIKEPNNYLTLSFVNSKFTNFPLNLFYVYRIQELDFRNCSVETLKWDNFLMGDKLAILLLSENLLKEIKPMLFTYAENLSFLFLDSNRINILHNDSFKGLEKLNYLDLHDNLIENLPIQIFSYLPAIQQINLAGNRLKIIAENLFEFNPHLFSIHLQHNHLEVIEEYAFQNQDNIKHLDISHNPNLQLLVFANIHVENLWAKNCSLRRVNIYGEAVHVDLEQNSIIELYFTQPEYLETLRLRDNFLEQISSLARTTDLRTLDVSNNPNLKTLPELWQINSLERLDLSNTSLKQIPITVLASPNRLRSLNVSSNQLEEINPINFKYFEKLSHFYIHNNNWNCYNLQMLMEMVIKPLKISYTYDVYDDNFPGEYIQGIKCMYRLDEASNEYLSENSNSNQQMNKSAKSLEFSETLTISPAQIQEYNQLKFENVKEVEKLRREFKAIVGIYEEKFSFLMNKLNELDLRLKEFEQFNQTLWKQISIVV